MLLNQLHQSSHYRALILLDYWNRNMDAPVILPDACSARNTSRPYLHACSFEKSLKELFAVFQTLSQDVRSTLVDQARRMTDTKDLVWLSGALEVR